MIHLASDAVTANHRVNGERKVQDRGSLWKGQDVAFWGENIEFGGKEIEFDGVEKVERVGLWVIQNFFNGIDPSVEFFFFDLRIRGFIFPMGSKSSFRHVIHSVGTNLHLNPFALVRHKGVVEGLIAVGFGCGEPVAKS